MYFFYVGKIQKQVIKKVTNTLKEKYDINLSINSSKLTIKDGVVLNDILILDHKKDTLVYLKKIETNINSYQKLIDNEYSFSKIFIDGLFLNIKKYDGEDKNNFEYFIDSINLKRNPEIKNPIVFVSNFELSSSKIIHPSYSSSIKIINLKSNNLNFNGDNFNAFNTFSEIDLKHNDRITFKSGPISLSAYKFSINDYFVNSIYGAASGFINYGDSIDPNNKKFYSKLELNKVNLDKLKLPPTNKTRPSFSSRMNISGDLDSIKVENIEFDLGQSKFYGDFILHNLFSKNDFNFSGKIKTNDFKLKSVESFFETFPKALNQIKNNDIEFELNTKYSKTNWNLSGNLSTVFGDFKVNLFDKNSTNQNLIQINKLNLQKINSSLPKGFFSGSVHYRYENDEYKWILSDSSYDFLNFESIGIFAK